MKKNTIKLLEGQLAEIIKDVTIKYLNETDGATYARIYNASHREIKEKNSNILHKSSMIKEQGQVIPNERLVKDNILGNAEELDSGVQKHWLKDYVGQTLKFYSEDRLGLVVDVLFTFKKIKSIDIKNTILTGTIIFNDTQIVEDCIAVDFINNKIQYHERGSRYLYYLEIDNRCKELWNNLLEQLKMVLDKKNNKENK